MIRIEFLPIQLTLTRVYRVSRARFPRGIRYVVRIYVFWGRVRRRRRITKARCGGVFYVLLAFPIEWPHVVVRESTGLNPVKVRTKLFRVSKDQDIEYRKYDCRNKRCSVWSVRGSVISERTHCDHYGDDLGDGVVIPRVAAP